MLQPPTPIHHHGDVGPQCRTSEMVRRQTVLSQQFLCSLPRYPDASETIILPEVRLQGGSCGGCGGSGMGGGVICCCI